MHEHRAFSKTLHLIWLKMKHKKSSMEVQDFLVASLLVSCLAASSHAVTLSSLPTTLIVSASATQGQDLKAGKDNITVTCSPNASLPAGTDSAYRTVKVEVCYAPVSQQGRAWRKTVDNLEKDKTCQHKIAARPYSPSGGAATWTVQKDVPTATYFIRAYVYNAAGEEVAHGQTATLFDVEAISGRHVSLDIASVCFSVFCVVSLFGFFFMEKRKAKSFQQK